MPTEMTKLIVTFRSFAIVPKTKKGPLSLPVHVLLTPTNAKFWIVLNYTGWCPAVYTKTRYKMNIIYYVWEVHLSAIKSP